MDEFGVLTERYGLKSQGKSAPMAASKRPNKASTGQTWNFDSNSTKSAYNSNSADASFSGSYESPFSNSELQNLGGLSDGFDIFGGFQTSSKQSNETSNGASFDYDSIFSNSSVSSLKSSFDDDIYGGLPSWGSANNEDIFGSFASKPPTPQTAPTDDLLGNFGSKSKSPSRSGSVGFDDLIPGFGPSSTSRKGENNGTAKSTFTSAEDPFVVLESTSTTTKSTLRDPREEFNMLGNSKSTKSGSSNVSPLLRPPPKPGQVLKTEKVKSSGVSPMDELDDFATVSAQRKADGSSRVQHAREGGGRHSAKSNKYKEAEDAARQPQHSSAVDLESFFGMASRSTSVPKSRPMSSDHIFDAKINGKGKPEGAQKKSSGASPGIKKASSTTNLGDELLANFGDSPFFGEFEEVEGETEERRRARLERHQRTQDRVAKAVADMNQRDLQSQYEQEERRMIADQMDAKIRHWARGKEGNMRALLSSLQHVLWPECGWEPISLTDLITSSSVKKVYRKATLCVHPDKVQQKGATLQQKYVAEKVFDILKEAWNKFNKEELS